MIKEITKVIEAHESGELNGSYGVIAISYTEYPALAAAIEKMVREEAEGFAEWINYNGHRYIEGAWRLFNGKVTANTTSELFTLYINSKNNSNG